jgi:SAM-dependent methyltransferase
MPFADGSFDGAYSMNVSMNIADKGAFYRGVHRVLRPEAWLVLSELAKGEGGDLDYPTPWASSGRASFLSTPEETRRGLLAADSTSFGCTAASRKHAPLVLARVRWSSAVRNRRIAPSC